MRELICITCPRGCHLTVDEEAKTVTGNSCPRGASYGLQEVLNPKRVVTSTVTIIGADLKRLPVRCDKPIDKKLMPLVMKELDKVIVKSPVKCGEIIIKNILGTDVNIISSRDL